MRENSGNRDGRNVNLSELERAEIIQRTEEIVGELEGLYGVPIWNGPKDPVEELVACILSQHTSDINSGRAFARLQQRYPTWEAVLNADTEELANTIRCGGLADSKAPRIQRVLAEIKNRAGAVDLRFLDEMSDTEARSYLMGLPGVGPKTAGIVLCFALGRNVLPVDTHVFRVAWRLGLIEKRIGEARSHDALQRLIRPEMTFRFHMALIQHGRRICKAPSPRCFDCPVTLWCKNFAENFTEEFTEEFTEKFTEKSDISHFGA